MLWGCPGRGGAFCSISRLYSLDVSSNHSPQVVTTQNVSTHCQMPSEGKEEAYLLLWVGGIESHSLPDSNCCHQCV